MGNALVLGNALAQSGQIAAMERFAPRYDARALTFLQMGVSCAGFTVMAVALGQFETPRGWTVWGALVVTGVFAGALGYLIATWVQARTTAARAALVFTLEAPFAALFGVLLADDRLGWLGWTGCAVMLAGILLAEPAAANALRRFAAQGHHLMDAVLLAATSAFLFGAMTVGLRYGLRTGVSPEVGTVFTVLTALGVIVVYAAVRSEWDLGGAWPFLLAGLLAPGCSQVLFTFAVRDAGPSRASVAVGTAPLVAVVIALVFLDEPLVAGLAVGAALDRRRRRPARQRARTTGPRPSDRAPLRVARDSRLRYPRQPHPLARHASHRGRPRCRRPGDDALRRGGHPRLRRRAPPPGTARRAAAVPAGWTLLRRSPTCACSRRSTAAGSVSSRRSSRPSRCGASALSALLLRRSELVGRRLALGAVLVVAGGVLIGAFR